MSKNFRFIKHPVTGKWIIIAPARAKRPTVAHGTEPVCPFCPGHEDLTPPETFRVGSDGKDKPGWQIRVVPNKYPFAPIHEVVIDSPDHSKNLFELDPKQTAKVFRVYKDRFNKLKNKGQVVVFYNWGVEAAASLPHPHAQITVIPKKVGIDVTRSVTAENIVHESKYFTVFIPEASGWPYEIWFLPKKRGRLFGDITNEEIDNLTSVLVEVYKKLQGILGSNFPFNFHIYHGGDWYLRFIPRLRVVGGFELATDVYIHSTDPKRAAEDLAW